MNINSITGNNYKNNFQPLKTFRPTFTAKGIFPGSFDPITNGHLDIIKRAASILDSLTVLVSKNPSKEKCFLSFEDRISIIKKLLLDEKLKNVQVASTTDYAVKYAQKDGSSVIIRGLRNGDDFEYEMQLSQTNQAIAPEIGTVFLITKPKYNFISSGIVKELSSLGQDVSKFVPKSVVEYLQKDKNKQRKADF